MPYITVFSHADGTRQIVHGPDVPLSVQRVEIDSRRRNGLPEGVAKATLYELKKAAQCTRTEPPAAQPEPVEQLAPEAIATAGDQVEDHSNDVATEEPPAKRRRRARGEDASTDGPVDELA